MAFIEDLSVFINEDTPGYKVLSINGGNVPGIFDDDYSETNFVESSNPVFIVMTADIPAITQGLKVVDGSIQYEIVGMEDNGTGITILELRLEWLT